MSLSRQATLKQPFCLSSLSCQIKSVDCHLCHGAPAPPQPTFTDCSTLQHQEVFLVEQSRWGKRQVALWEWKCTPGSNEAGEKQPEDKVTWPEPQQACRLVGRLETHTGDRLNTSINRKGVVTSRLLHVHVCMCMRLSRTSSEETASTTRTKAWEFTSLSEEKMYKQSNNERGKAEYRFHSLQGNRSNSSGQNREEGRKNKTRLWG